MSCQKNFQGTQKQFESVTVNEPPVFESCIGFQKYRQRKKTKQKTLTQIVTIFPSLQHLPIIVSSSMIT